MPRHSLCALYSLTLQFFYDRIYLLFKDLPYFFTYKKPYRSFKTEYDEYRFGNFRYFYVSAFLLRKEVIHPHVPVGIPCYDLTPIIDPTLDGSLLTVRPPALGIINFRGLTGGVYKPRERIHRGVLIRDY